MMTTDVDFFKTNQQPLLYLQQHNFNKNTFKT